VARDEPAPTDEKGKRTRLSDANLTASRMITAPGAPSAHAPPAHSVKKKNHVLDDDPLADQK
jgi:hypothetical protein